MQTDKISEYNMQEKWVMNKNNRFYLVISTQLSLGGNTCLILFSDAWYWHFRGMKMFDKKGGF